MGLRLEPLQSADHRRLAGTERGTHYALSLVGLRASRVSRHIRTSDSEHRGVLGQPQRDDRVSLHQRAGRNIGNEAHHILTTSER